MINCHLNDCGNKMNKVSNTLIPTNCIIVFVHNYNVCFLLNMNKYLKVEHADKLLVTLSCKRLTSKRTQRNKPCPFAEREKR